MSWIAWKMLTGDRSKYLGIVFGVAFASLLMAHQVSIFVGIMRRTTSQIRDVKEAKIWVMHPDTRYVEEIEPLSETDLQRVRGVTGVSWAVRFYKGLLRARLPSGDYRQIIVLGLDDATLVGAPETITMGNLADLRRPDAVLLDESGYQYLWPGEPFELGKTLELNDRRAVLVGICKASPPFQTFPIMYTRYSQAMLFAPPERKLLSFVLAAPQEGHATAEVCERIGAQTRLKAVTSEGFADMTMTHYIRYTGIPFNFGITVLLGFIVGVAIAGQTFYLFTLENLKQFGALKAMGVTNTRIIGMVLLQATIVGLIGYGIGMGFAALFFEATKNAVALQGFFMPWQVMAIVAVAVFVIVLLASFMSIRRVLVLEPAIVFRGVIAMMEVATDLAVMCRSVTKDFGEGETRVQALRGVDLDVPTGELSLLVGESGCGKTTLISIIAGLLDPTAGEVSVLGEDLGRMSGRRKVAFLAANIGFVFQQYNLLPSLTAAENAAVPLLIAGMPRRQAVEKAATMLDLLGLGSRTRSLPSQLSGGQQQRVAIARALVHEPRLLVCDEPTAALDAASGRKVMELVRRVAVQPGRAVIIVTHDHRVFDFGDRIIHMSDGMVERVEEKPSEE